MLAGLPRVALQVNSPLGFDLGLLGVEEGVERNLGVGDEAAALGQQEAGVGAQPAVFGVQRLLQLEVDVLGHAGDLDAAAQLQLAPLAAGLRLAQGLLQARGLGVEVADGLAHLLEQGAGLQVGLAAPPHLCLDLLLALGDPLGQGLDLRLALVERRLGGLGVELARLLVHPQQLGDRLRGGLLDRRTEVGLRLRLLAPRRRRRRAPRRARRRLWRERWSSDRW